MIGIKALEDENEIMMIPTEGIIIQLRMQDISTMGRITSGVKMMDLEEGVKVAKIAKVREKISNGEQEFDNVDDAMLEIQEQDQTQLQDQENESFAIEDTRTEEEILEEKMGGEEEE